MDRPVRTLLVALLVAGSCAAPPRPAGTPPPDFALGLSVRGAAGTALAPAWYIVEADGTLRAGLGVRHERTPAPGLVRVLRPDERAEVWRLAAAIDADAPGAVSAGAPGPGEGSFYLARDGRRSTVVLDEIDARPDVARLAARLAELAWVSPP
ncbi:MAG: hypothetical protein SFY69_01785 [Planctomycetota bacterium]|nr:hypothetical protein [Planctomycetota bacterium]